jgi:phosphoribosyl 1,2-cyclic phosphodiesterase
MPLTLCVLGSGSSGNCVYVASETTRLLVDAGLSGKATAERLDAIGVDPDSLDAVCVTHEHADHRASLATLQRRHAVKLYANSGTVEGIRRTLTREVPWTVFHTGQPFAIGDIRVDPFSVPHDCSDPVGFSFSAPDGAQVCVATDMGVVTTSVRDRLGRCHAAVLESNHDETMLNDSSRPWSLKKRIAGRLGHLSNTQAADTIVELAAGPLQTVFLAHISRDCNTGELALKTTLKRLAAAKIKHIDVKLTSAGSCAELITVTGVGDVR